MVSHKNAKAQSLAPEEPSVYRNIYEVYHLRMEPRVIRFKKRCLYVLPLGSSSRSCKTAL